MDENILESLRAGEYEKTPEGIFIPSGNILAQGVFSVAKRGEPEEFTQNLVVNQGLDYILSAAVGATAGIANWYIALFSGDVTVNATWTAATFTATATEWTAYDEAARPAWSPGAVASAGIDSFASKASFTSSSDAQVVRGAAMISASAKSATSGTLLASSRLSSDKTLDTGEILDVGYGLQLSAV